MDLMAALIERGAPLEKKNVWGGTVLDSTVYFAVHQLIGGVDYPRVLEALIAAGANVSAVTPFPTGHPVIDETAAASRRPAELAAASRGRIGA